MAKKSLNTGTTLKQRIFIWVILILTVVSTIALYASMFLQQSNRANDDKAKTEELTKAQKAYQKDAEEVQAKNDKIAKDLSDKYFGEFKQYEKKPEAFNAANVKELKTNDIKVGDGEEITDKSDAFYAYYIGWRPDGVVFDSSFNKSHDGLQLPIAVTKEDGKWSVIDGWSEGVKGMRVGGVRELTIPADKAYGVVGSKNPEDESKSIESNMPIKFIVMLIPKFETVPMPNQAEYFKNIKGLGA